MRRRSLARARRGAAWWGRSGPGFRRRLPLRRRRPRLGRRPATADGGRGGAGRARASRRRRRPPTPARPRTPVWRPRGGVRDAAPASAAVRGRRRGAAADVAIDGREIRRRPVPRRRAAAPAASRTGVASAIRNDSVAASAGASSGDSSSPSASETSARVIGRRPVARRAAAATAIEATPSIWSSASATSEAKPSSAAASAAGAGPAPAVKPMPGLETGDWDPAWAGPATSVVKSTERLGNRSGESIRADAYRFICSVSTRISSATVMLRELAW